MRSQLTSTLTSVYSAHQPLKGPLTLTLLTVLSFPGCAALTHSTRMMMRLNSPLLAVSPLRRFYLAAETLLVCRSHMFSFNVRYHSYHIMQEAKHSCSSYAKPPSVHPLPWSSSHRTHSTALSQTQTHPCVGDT